MTVVEHGERSRWIDLDGPVHYLDFGGPASGPTIVGVHGLGGAALNWCAIAPLLSGRYRILAPDLAGHGLTQSEGRATSVNANQVLLHRFIETVPGSPVILMGNSMGGMISLLEASAAPEAAAGLILIDPALPFAAARPDPLVAAMFAMYIMPGLGRVMMRRRRMSPEALVSSMLALCCVDPARVPADIVSQHVDLARRRAAFTGLDRDFATALNSVVATVGFLRGAAYRRGIRSITCPVLLLHGTRDRLVPIAAARAAARANPSWSLIEFLEVGHVPQLEAPGETAKVIVDWLGSTGRAAAESATHGPPPIVA
jgi:pimeloyl-ACP methyl ester carboxylesterase